MYLISRILQSDWLKTESWFLPCPVKSTMTGHSKILLQSPLVYVYNFLVRRREQNFAAIPIGLRVKFSFIFCDGASMPRNPFCASLSLS